MDQTTKLPCLLIGPYFCRHILFPSAAKFSVGDLACAAFGDWHESISTQRDESNVHFTEHRQLLLSSNSFHSKSVSIICFLFP